uniref:MH2 domain-containing protein n=1 Tax=Panagrellus redivivus TaxID=6233 RepID=A0A7E4VHF7_PANRE
MSTTTAESPPDSQSNTLQRSHAASERNATSHRSNTVSPHRRLQSQRVSRAGLVYGSSFSRGSCLDGARRFAADLEDMWYDSERFQLDHINEVLSKLNDGSLDDEIWGKIVVMERCKRIAKAYLRKTTVIVDGGEEEFDGKTLGFNYFNNPLRDEYTKELRSKIGDGVIIKMDNQGNIKAMARGSTPVFVQGWKDGKTHCTSDKVIRNQGKLITKTGTGAVSDEDRVVKIFDMRRFKQCVERDPYESESDARNLLLKTCVRVALVKDGGAADPMKTPCWFMIINLVALDMLKTKLPSVCISPILNPIHSNTDSSRLSRIMSQVSLVPPHHSASASDLYSNPAALTQLIAAAVQQANNTYVASQPAGLNVEQLAQIANTLTNPAVLAAAVQQNFQKGHHASTNLSMSTSTSSAIGPNRRQRRNRSFSDSDSELETRTAPIRGPSANYGSTTGSSSGISGVGHSTPRSKGAKSMEALHQQSKSPRRESESLKAPQVGNKDRLGRPLRPKLSESLFENPKQPAETTAVKPWKSCASTTSDYDSNREVFDSGSWSSNSRVSTNSRDDEEPRSYSPSIGSESDQHLAVPENQDDGRRNSVPNAIAEQAGWF